MRLPAPVPSGSRIAHPNAGTGLIRKRWAHWQPRISASSSQVPASDVANHVGHPLGHIKYSVQTHRPRPTAGGTDRFPGVCPASEVPDDADRMQHRCGQSHWLQYPKTTIPLIHGRSCPPGLSRCGVPDGAAKARGASRIGQPIRGPDAEQHRQPQRVQPGGFFRPLFGRSKRGHPGRMRDMANQ
jgi:hypothetical protein